MRPNAYVHIAYKRSAAYERRKTMVWKKCKIAETTLAKATNGRVDGKKRGNEIKRIQTPHTRE